MDDPIQETMVCPQCGAEIDDFDGLGVLSHSCGYCTHPNSTLEDGRWICGFCSKEVTRCEA